MSASRFGTTQIRRDGSYVARIASVAFFVLAISVVTAWASLALWYRLPTPEWARNLAAGLFVLLGFATIIAFFGRARVPTTLAFAAAIVAVLVWWSTIRPVGQADWAPDVARQVTGVRTATVFGQSMHLLVDENISRAQIEEKLRSVGISQTEIHEIGPSLEDVFVTLSAKHAAEKQQKAA